MSDWETRMSRAGIAVAFEDFIVSRGPRGCSVSKGGVHIGMIVNGLFQSHNYSLSSEDLALVEAVGRKVQDRLHWNIPN